MKKLHKYTAEDTLEQIKYMCELWDKGAFEGVSGIGAKRKSGITDKGDADIFVSCISLMTGATGKTERFVDKIMEDRLHLNSLAASF